MVILPDESRVDVQWAGISQIDATLNSPFASNRMDYLHYVDWSEDKRNPKILKTEDYKRLICSGKLMARKFDNTVDAGIIEKLRLRISEKHFTSEG